MTTVTFPPFPPGPFQDRGSPQLFQLFKSVLHCSIEEDIHIAKEQSGIWTIYESDDLLTVELVLLQRSVETMVDNCL